MYVCMFVKVHIYSNKSSTCLYASSCVEFTHVYIVSTTMHLFKFLNMYAYIYIYKNLNIYITIESMRVYIVSNTMGIFKNLNI